MTTEIGVDLEGIRNVPDAARIADALMASLVLFARDGSRIRRIEIMHDPEGEGFIIIRARYKP